MPPPLDDALAEGGAEGMGTDPLGIVGSAIVPGAEAPMPGPPDPAAPLPSRLLAPTFAAEVGGRRVGVVLCGGNVDLAHLPWRAP